MCQDCGCSVSDIKEEKSKLVLTDILDKNNQMAKHNQDHLHKNKIFCINLMSSPGSGKTTLLEATLHRENPSDFAVIEGDLETNNDANRILAAGGRAFQVTTGQTCHLDANMVHHALHHLDLDQVKTLFIENVGNLVCPASYKLGEHANVVLLSVTEGSDKIAKYPVIFRHADLIIITKASLIEHFDFSIDEAKMAAKRLNPHAKFIVLDSKTGLGMDEWIDFIKTRQF